MCEPVWRSGTATLRLHGTGVVDAKLRLDPAHLASVLEVKCGAGLHTDFVAGHCDLCLGPRDLLKLLHAEARLERAIAGIVFIDRVLRSCAFHEV